MHKLITLQNCLWIWQIIGLVLILQDPTITGYLLIVGVIINLLFFFYLSCNIFKQPINLLTYGVVIMLLSWYVYYTQYDITNPGYTILQKICYGLIDIGSIVYLIGSLLLLTVTQANNYLKLGLPMQILQRVIFGPSPEIIA